MMTEKSAPRRRPLPLVARPYLRYLCTSPLGSWGWGIRILAGACIYYLRGLESYRSWLRGGVPNCPAHRPSTSLFIVWKRDVLQDYALSNYNIEV